MWLMEQLAGQYPTLVKRGLQLKEYDIYNPNGTSLKDAVVSFDGGCTGEVISSQGLVLTNHHCGYDAIQRLSSVEHNYLQDGYWAKSFADELPAKGVVVTFIDRIEDVTSYVQSELKKIKKGNGMEFLSPSYLEGLARKKYGEAYLRAHPGTEVEIKPFYNGSKYLLFVKKVYSDIRFVGAPPSSIGKFGADTDNWRYPRHTGDFSIFRIYADANGNPATYSKDNVPLRPKRWFNISTSGVEKGSFAMIMGFPGRTNHFALPDEIREWRDIDNQIRIRMRGIRQEVMLREMLADPKINIMYAAKYARSQNGHKRAMGANWGISRSGFMTFSQETMERVKDWATEGRMGSKARVRYAQSITDIDGAIKERAAMRREYWLLDEGIFQAIELTRAPGLDLKPTDLEKAFHSYCNEDYSPVVDAKIAKAVLAEYIQQAKQWPEALRQGLNKCGSVEAYVDALFAQSYFTSEEGVVVLYGSMYGNTEQLADVIAQSLVAHGVKRVVCHNVSKSDPSDILCDIFSCRGLIIGSPTYCGELFSPIENLLQLIRIRDVKDRLYAAFGSYTWAPGAVKRLVPFAEEMKWELVGEAVELKMSDLASVLDAGWSLGQAMAERIKA